MRRKSIYVNAPNFLLVSLGGAVATILCTAMIYLAPVARFPVLDLPTLLGGVFFADPAVAFWTGYAGFFIGGWLLAPAVLKQFWRRLPGDRESFRGAALKGLLLGAGLWVASGILVGILSAVHPLPVVGEMGFFAAGYGIPGVAALLIGHLVYGVAFALVAAMGRGLSPIDAIGWLGHGSGRSA